MARALWACCPQRCSAARRSSPADEASLGRTDKPRRHSPVERSCAPGEAVGARESIMGVPFRGVINTDIRDSVPDWSPFEPPKAPDGSPSVVYIVLDDVGFSAMGCYGGPVETPNIER